jgi:hypothetical protein
MTLRRVSSIEELHEGRHVKAGERQEVVDRASQKGLPRIRVDKTNVSGTTQPLAQSA